MTVMMIVFGIWWFSSELEESFGECHWYAEKPLGLYLSGNPLTMSWHSK